MNMDIVCHVKCMIKLTYFVLLSCLLLSVDVVGLLCSYESHKKQQLTLMLLKRDFVETESVHLFLRNFIKTIIVNNLSFD